MTTQPATRAEVRKHYEDQGCEVIIDRDDHVTYGAIDGWHEGRWVSEYVIDNEGMVYLR